MNIKDFKESFESDCCQIIGIGQTKVEGTPAEWIKKVVMKECFGDLYSQGYTFEGSDLDAIVVSATNSEVLVGMVGQTLGIKKDIKLSNVVADDNSLVLAIKEAERMIIKDDCDKVLVIGFEKADNETICAVLLRVIAS